MSKDRQVRFLETNKDRKDVSHRKLGLKEMAHAKFGLLIVHCVPIIRSVPRESAYY